MEVPYALGPEKSVLSSMVKSQAVRARAAVAGLTEDHFHMPNHRLLFQTMRDKDAAGIEVELVSLVEDLRRDGVLDSAGGPGGISEIYGYAPHEAHFEQHLQMLRESLSRRLALQSSLDISNAAPTAAPEDLAKALRDASERAAAALRPAAGSVTAKEGIARLRAQLVALQDADASVPGLATGLVPIDLVTGGIWPAELWVVAAETSGGKSVVMMQAALAALQEGKRVFIISFEMQAEVILGRMVSNLRSITNEVWRKPKMQSPTVLQRAALGMNEMEQMPITIDDVGGRTIDHIAALAQAEIDRYGKLDLIVVDYLQRIEGSGIRGQTRAQELGSFSKALKSLAMKTKVPVFTASQLNDDGRLFESRAIGHDADVVLRVTDEGIIGDKVRNGARDQLFPLALNGEYQRFETKRN